MLRGGKCCALLGRAAYLLTATNVTCYCRSTSHPSLSSCFFTSCSQTHLNLHFLLLSSELPQKRFRPPSWSRWETWNGTRRRYYGWRGWAGLGGIFLRWKTLEPGGEGEGEAEISHLKSWVGGGQDYRREASTDKLSVTQLQSWGAGGGCPMGG